MAMSATESAYANERVLAIDPFDAEKGLLEEAMVTIVLPYVKTAQEGVKRLGEIVEKYGAAESNGILFADRDEGLVLGNRVRPPLGCPENPGRLQLRWLPASCQFRRSTLRIRPTSFIQPACRNRL